MSSRIFQLTGARARGVYPVQALLSVISVLKILIVVQSAFLVAACAGHRAPTTSLEQPPSRRLQYHSVSQGETLYAIAWRYGKDYRELAAINRIPEPYRIYPGQRITLVGNAPPVAAPAPAPEPSPSVRKPVASKPARREPEPISLTRDSSRQVAVRPSAAGIDWQWPSKGRVISRFQAQDSRRKGVDIAGEKGDPVLAAADGTVIYAGSALRGYGNLLIVKHSEEFLSAYAHNHKLLVGEGAAVKKGQRIAELGSSGTDRDMLHFEIRRNGQPVDPLAYLP